MYYYRQEGWRLEHETVADQNSPIVFKGVVFNEMKGVFVSVSCRIHFRKSFDFAEESAGNGFIYH